jgi:hypothetical protein
VLGKYGPGNQTYPRRTNLGDLLAPADWTTVAVRAAGSRLWLLLDEQPVLFVDDSAFQPDPLATDVDPNRLG